MFDEYGVNFIFNGQKHNYLRMVPINLNESKNSAVYEYGDKTGQGRC